MAALFRLLVLRHVRRHPLRALLALLSVALGVALFTSTEVAHASARAAYERAAAQWAGRAVWQIERGPNGPADANLLSLVEADGRFDAAPVVEGVLVLPPSMAEGRLLLRGIDPLREARMRDLSFDRLEAVDLPSLLADATGLIVSHSLASRLGLAVGESIEVGTAAGRRTVRLAAIAKDDGPLAAWGGRIAFMRLEGAMELLARGSSFDRIDVAPARSNAGKGAAESEVQLGAALEALAGAGSRVRAARGGRSTLDDMLANLRALVVLSVIGLLVGLFIVYLSISIGVLERSHALATARSLGATPRQVALVFLIEAGVLGVLGSLLGLAMGWAMARGTVGLIEDTINRLVFLVAVDDVILPGRVAAIATIAGTATALLAAWSPARRAARISPAAALRPAVLGSQLLPRYGRAAVVGIALLAIGAATVAFVQLRAPPWVGLCAMALLFAGTALVLPRITIALSRRLRTPLRRMFHAEGFLAADNLLRYPQRSSLTVVALGGALALLVTSAAIVAGFQRTTSLWLEAALPFDFSLQPARLGTTIYSNATLPGDLVTRVRQIEGVAAAYGVRARVERLEDHEILLLAIDMDAYREVLRMRGRDLDGARSSRDADTSLLAGRSVGISQNLAVLDGLELGDTVRFSAPRGEVVLPIAFITEDYSWPRGSVAVERSLYETWWQDDTVTYVDVALAPGADRATVRQRIEAGLGAEIAFVVYDADDIRAYAKQSLEQSFLLVDAQVGVAMVIGFLGILNTMLLSVLGRRREIGLLRVVGMTRRGVARTVAIEAVIVSLLGGLFGVATGLIAAFWPAANHLLLVTGYEVPPTVPWGTIALVFVSSTAIGVVASILPARRAASLEIVDAIHYE